MSLGKKIRELRTAKGLTQSDLASGIVTSSMISQIEWDKANPSYKVLELIAEKLEAPLEHFLSDVQMQMEEKSIHKFGRALLAARRYEQAVDALHDLYNRPPSNVDPIELNLDLGKGYFCLEKYDEAVVHFGQALELAEENGNHYAAIHALHYLGLVEKVRNKYHSAVFYWRTAYERFGQLAEAEPFLQSQILINLGTIHQELSEFEESLQYLDEAYQYSADSKDFQRLGDVYLGLGINFGNLRDYIRAMEYTQYAAAIYESIERVKLSIDTKKRYAILKGENGKCDEGIQILEECMREYLEHKYPIDAAAVRGEIASLYLREHRFEEARQECERALSDLTDEHVEKASVLRVFAKTEDALGNPEVAIKYAEHAKELFKKHGVLNEVIETLSILDELYQKQGNSQKAAECVRKMKELLDQILRGRGIVL